MAVYPTAASHPDLSGSLIPTIWAAKLNAEFYNSTVFTAIANTEHEKKIKGYGDTVRIRTLPSITIRDYVKGQGLTYQKPSPSYVDLLIDQGKYFALSINTVDVAQADMNYVNDWAVHASEVLASGDDGIDKNVLANIYGSVSADNAGSTAGKKSNDINLGVAGTPLQFTKVNALEVFVDMGTVLDEQNVPQSGRWAVIPAWACGMIKKSDLKDASLTGDGQSVLRNGRIGMIDRFEVFMSNNLTTSSSGGHTAYECVFGHKSGLTFASQVTEKEIIPNPDDFGKLMRGLQVYGYKVTKGEALGHLHIYK